MRYADHIPSDLDGETALIIVDILHLIAEEILSRNYGAIHTYYDELDETRLSGSHEQTQLTLPLMDPFHDLPF